MIATAREWYGSPLSPCLLPSKDTSPAMLKGKQSNEWQKVLWVKAVFPTVKCEFRYTPESGLNSDIMGGPVGARSTKRHFIRQSQRPACEY